MKPESIPAVPGDLQGMSVVVLDNVKADGLSDEQMLCVKRYVRDLGGGLIVLGGPDSYGHGGYTGTALEETLPVWCNPERRRNVSLVLVLDASGSMQNSTVFEGEQMWKFRAALKAIQPAYRELRNGDEVAIITFTTEPTLDAGLRRYDRIRRPATQRIVRQARLVNRLSTAKRLASVRDRALTVLAAGVDRRQHLDQCSAAKSSSPAADRDSSVTPVPVAATAPPIVQDLRSRSSRCWPQ